MPFLETSFSVMMAWAAAGAASLLLAAAPVEGFSQEQRLICICIAGGIGGGILSVILFPKTTLRSTAAKWLVSPITSGMFGPAFCQFYGIQQDIWYSLAATGAIGLFAWSVLFVIMPLVPDIARHLARKWFPDFFKVDQCEMPPQYEEPQAQERPEAKLPTSLQDRGSRRYRKPPPPQ